MDEYQQLAKSVLQTMEDLGRLVDQVEAEPVWQLRKHLTEPARTQIAEFAEGLTDLKGHLERLEDTRPVLEQVRDGQLPVEEIRPDFREILTGMLGPVESMKSGMLAFLGMARGMRDGPSSEGAGSSLN